ncbi:hypothetical protein HU200_010820 [Digitaria exilis]|uniref:Uncharacterized protein n=1 Tax=Digitaria exilis TaxID=1010633 RepID=A0A835FGV5_9POAL|nr:hypothetical protein HU200_010820 [Digitaria exilis]
MQRMRRPRRSGSDHPGEEGTAGEVRGKRRELREKMFKKTRSGQPVMRHRIEHLLETALQG